MKPEGVLCALLPAPPPLPPLADTFKLLGKFMRPVELIVHYPPEDTDPIKRTIAIVATLFLIVSIPLSLALGSYLQ